jgi:hypothetical protein
VDPLDAGAEHRGVQGVVPALHDEEVDALVFGEVDDRVLGVVADDLAVVDGDVELGGQVRGAALELADDDIRVNAVAPGHIATEFGSGAEQKEESVEAGDLMKPIPLARPGYPEDIAPAVLFLASEQAGYVTGEMVYVDGGWQIF